MSTKAIRAALEGRLATWAAARSPALRVSYENVPFTPTAGETYLAAYMLPATTRSQDLAGDHRGYGGVFQVNVTSPINVGPGAADGIAAELDTLFPVNGRYTSGGVTVQIIGPASVGPAPQDPERYSEPVSITYRADTI